VKKKLFGNRLIRFMDFGIWPGMVMLCTGFEYDYIVKHLEKCKADFWLEMVKHEKELMLSAKWLAVKREVAIDGKAQTLYMIYLKECFDFSDFSMVALAHEVMHICHFHLKDILTLDKEHEAVAYTHSYIMENCLIHMRKPVKKSVKRIKVKRKR
jgi:hypothetical protein